MQIKAVNVNAAGLAAEKGVGGAQRIRTTDTNYMQTENAFGVECKVTISREGKELSSLQRQAVRTEKGTQSAKPERMVRQSQEETEHNKGTYEEYRDKLDEIDREISTLNSSYRKEKDEDETIGKQQEVLRAMRNLKEFQNEQSQRLEKEAKQAAMQSAGYQNEIDENNRELLTLLRTMDEAEKAEEERESGGESGSGNGDGNAASGKANSVSDIIQNSAAHYMLSSAEREWGVQEAIAGLGDEGHQHLKLADTITESILDTTKNIRNAMNDEFYTDEQIAEMVKFLEDGTTKSGFAEEYRKRGWKIGMELNYDDVKYARSWGLQNLQDAQEVKIQYLGDNTAGSVQKTQESMMLSAVDAALGKARQSGIDKASRELEEEVEELIDERSDADRIREDREQDEEVKEEREEQTELPQTADGSRGNKYPEYTEGGRNNESVISSAEAI